MSGEPSDEAQASAQAAFRLRTEPPRVTRLSRKVLAALAGIAAAGVGGALIVALQTRHPPKPTEALDITGARATAEALAGAPKDYSQIPKLGPPLPGDLGRPILSASGRGVDAAPPPNGGPSPATSDPTADRARQARDAARASHLFASSGPAGVVAGTSPAAPSPVLGLPAVASGEPAATTTPTGQAAKRAFLAGAASTATTMASGHLARPISPYVLQAGAVIPAALITGLRSDLPGQITAQVTQNVYDSPTGRLLLIPQGARLIGEYDSDIAFGQERALLVWTRLILPGGASISLDREPGADPQGFAGLQDRVEQHWSRIARAALVSTLLGVGAELGAGDDSELVRALRRGTQDTLNQTGQAVVRRELDVQPTLTIRPGHPVRVIVTRDLILEPPAPEPR
jgi:type IV secretory pathway VirB10-like protein